MTPQSTGPATGATTPSTNGATNGATTGPASKKTSKKTSKTSKGASDPAPLTVVREFLEAVAVPDVDRATSLLSPDVEWRNSGLPTFRGKRVHGMLRDMVRRGISFDVDFHAVAGEGDTVLTDRTDYLAKGPLRTGFRVRGTFVVRDGLITRWDDAFSYGGILTGFLRR